MSERNHRSANILSGTGFYIALFLGLTALAVAGYWMLLPSHEKAEPVASPQEIAVPDPEPPEEVIPEPEMPEVEPESVQAPVWTPAPQSIPEPVTPPQLIVSPLTGETLSVFSMDELLYSETLSDWRTHDGIDIAAEPGTQVLAACSGTVLSVADDDMMGTTVVIGHDDGYETVYANLQSITTVEPEEYVSAGQVIGSVGKTSIAEAAETPHLHFSVRQNGEPIDPADFLG